MKKVLCFIIAVIMCIGVSACQSSTSAPSETTSPVATSSSTSVSTSETSQTGVVIPKDLPMKQIAVMYPNWTTQEALLKKSALEQLESTFNVRFIFVEQGNSLESSLAALETVLQQDIDGIIGGTSAAGLKACADAGNVPIVFNGNMSAEIMKTASEYPNFLGNVASDLYQGGVECAIALYEAGCRKVGAIGIPLGIAPSMDDRYYGFKDQVDKYPDMEIIASDFSMGLFANAISSFAAAYPEMDGLFSEVTNEMILQTLNTEGLVGKVKYAGFDFSSTTAEYFENGTLVYDIGGHYANTLFAFAVMYNYLYDGTMIISDTETPILGNEFGVGSAEEYNLFMKYSSTESRVFDANEVAAMIMGFNPDFSPDMFAELVTSYSLEDLVARRTK